jgi:hypothetical protein
MGAIKPWTLLGCVGIAAAIAVVVVVLVVMKSRSK